MAETLEATDDELATIDDTADDELVRTEEAIDDATDEELERTDDTMEDDWLDLEDELGTTLLTDEELGVDEPHKVPLT